MPDFGLLSESALTTLYPYVIYKTGSNYIAFNTLTKKEEFINSLAPATFNSVITAMNANGGGTAAVRSGLYPIGGPILTKNYCRLVGENKNNTILRSTTAAADSSIFRYYNGPTSASLDGFELRDLQFQMQNLAGDGTGDSESAWYSSGTKNFKMLDCIIRSFASAGSFMRIGFFLDTAGGTNYNTNAEVKFNEFYGSCGGQDMLGSGMMLDCDVSQNYFHDLTSQAIGVGATYRSLYNQNRFARVGNCVGFEANCENNEVNDNLCYITTGIKLSGEGTSVNTSTGNICSRNTLQFGNAGIEDGNGHFDIIEDNNIYRTARNGIRGSFVNCSLQRNKLIDTNFNNNSQAVNSVSHTTGGIMMFNNTTPIPSASNNLVNANILIDTGVAFTDPVSGLSKNANTGPIVFDTSYNLNTALFNKYQGLPSGNLVNYGTNLQSFDSERVGKAQANGGGTSYTIAHGLGAIPTYVFVQMYSHNIAFTYTWDITNITITTASAPPGGTNNVLFVWRVIA